MTDCGFHYYLFDNIELQQIIIVLYIYIECIVLGNPHLTLLAISSKVFLYCIIKSFMGGKKIFRRGKALFATSQKCLYVC